MGDGPPVSPAATENVAARTFGGHEKLPLVVARLQGPIGTAREAPGNHLVSREAPGNHLGNPDCPGNQFGRQPGRLQGPIWTAREARESGLDSPGGTRRLERQSCATDIRPPAEKPKRLWFRVMLFIN